MKKLLLLLFGSFAFFMANAQKSIVPEIVEVPLTGIGYLEHTYPYIQFQEVDTLHPGSWVNSTLNTFISAPYPGYQLDKKYAAWESTKWTTYSETMDSFIVDNQNRFSIVFEDMKYSYPGFSDRYKSKYAFTYDGNGRVSVLDVKQANPATSNNYQELYSYIYQYDGSGKRISDTMYYVQTPKPLVTKYVYNGSGKLLAGYTISLDPAAPKDTTNKVFYQWNGNNLLSTSSFYYDGTAGGYLMQNADTFEYNNLNQITKHIQYYLASVNGGPYELYPGTYETFAYSTSGKLTEVQSSYWSDTEWQLSSKTVILYDGNDMPTIAFSYPYDNGSWGTVAFGRRLFNNPTGISEVKQAASTVKVFPNPTHGMLTLHSQDQVQISKVELFDLTGKCVVTLFPERNTNIVQMDVSMFQSGIYFVEWTQPNGKFSSKIKIE